MEVTKRERLLAEGYELLTRFEVGVPVFVWVCDLELVHDRNLGLIEETLLRLIDAGLQQRNILEQATGLDDKILTRSLIEMFERGALRYDQDQNLELSLEGKRMLLNAKARVQSIAEDVYVRHDPYTDSLAWRSKRPQKDLSMAQLKAAGYRKLGGIAPLDGTRLQERYREIQALIDSEGLPESRSKYSGKLEVLRVTPNNVHTNYRPMDLDVWHRRDGYLFDWVLTRGGVEEADVIRALEQAQADGAEIIPQETPRAILPVPPQNESLHKTAESASKAATGSNILHTLELRDAIRQAFEDAQRVLHVISPWLNRGAIDSEMTSWIQAALEDKPELRIVIGYGIEQLPDAARNAKDARAHSALRHLVQLSARHSNRILLREIGNTHEKIIVVDASYAYIGSFNWLSFNPKLQSGPGIRSEIGYRITNQDDLRDLLTNLKQRLEEAPERLT